LSQKIGSGQANSQDVIPFGFNLT